MTYKLIICHQCRVGIAPEHLRSHLITKHKIYHPTELLETLLRSYSVMSLKDTIEFIERTDILSEPIGGLPTLYSALSCQWWYGILSTMPPQKSRFFFLSANQRTCAHERMKKMPSVFATGFCHRFLPPVFASAIKLIWDASMPPTYRIPQNRVNLRQHITQPLCNFWRRLCGINKSTLFTMPIGNTLYFFTSINHERPGTNPWKFSWSISHSLLLTHSGR